MYKLISFIQGAIIAIMILSNGLMASAIGNPYAIVLNHLIGLTTIGFVVIATKNKWLSLKGIPLLYLTGGLTGLVTVYATNIAFIGLGATLTLMIGMVSRIISSLVIDHFGLMGNQKYRFVPPKLIGVGLMTVGLVIIVLSN